MILVIDAFNLIYKIDGLDEDMFRGRLEAAMRGLIKKMAEYDQRTNKKHEIHIFFDGKKKHGDETKRARQGRLYLYYSHDLSADHLIREFINRHPAPGNIRVVSSDKEVRHHARQHRCHLYTSEEYASILEQESTAPKNDREALLTEKPQDLSAEEVEYWEQMFLKSKQPKKGG